MQKLTQRTVDITKGPDRGKLIIRDSELKGFGLSVSSVSKSYIVDCRVNGIKRRVTVGRAELLSLDEARTKARELLSKMTMGIDPNAEKRLEKVAGITLREILDVYLATKQLKPSTINCYRLSRARDNLYNHESRIITSKIAGNATVQALRQIHSG